ITHSDRLSGGGREGAARNLTDNCLARRIAQFRAVSRRGPSLESEADADACRAILKLALDAGCSGEPAFAAAALADGNGQAGLNGRNLLVHVLSVEAKAGFEAQRIAGAKADGAHPRVVEEGTRQSLGMFCRNGDFETVFARIARTADIDRNSGKDGAA